MTETKSHRQRKKYRKKLLALGPQLYDLLEEYLNHPDTQLRIAAIGVLKEIHTHHALALLIERLKSDVLEKVRYRAADFLGHFKTRESVDALMGALYDKSDSVKLCACASLEHLTGCAPAEHDSKLSHFSKRGNLVIDPERLNQTVEFWLAWWKENGATFKVPARQSRAPDTDEEAE